MQKLKTNLLKYVQGGVGGGTGDGPHDPAMAHIVITTKPPKEKKKPRSEK
ncbi:hypothetical protein [Pseudoalteromonas rubra]|nr:hypothetical protein [Pseudoalteromonas rubra]